jgi:hypothetical protein
MSADELDFTVINYAVCNYCKHLVRAGHRDGFSRGCYLIQNEDGQYGRVTLFDKDDEEIYKKNGIDAINELNGCEKFESSGLPAHPQVLSEIIKANEKCSTIPTDPNATETSWDFENKIGQYPHKDVPLLNDQGKHSIQ